MPSGRSPPPPKLESTPFPLHGCVVLGERAVMKYYMDFLHKKSLVSELSMYLRQRSVEFEITLNKSHRGESGESVLDI